MKTALVTGILGQDGPYLAKLLLSKGYKVYGMVRRHSNPSYSNLDFLDITNDVEYVEGDLTDELSLMNLVKNLRPDEIYNLAAQSFVGLSWEQSKVTTEANALGVLYMLNAIKTFSPTSKFYQASTSEIFGNSNVNGVQDENTSFKPRSSYGISKLYAYWTTVNFRESYNMFTCNGILFNHESPIRGKQFVTRKISDGVSRIKYGLLDKLHMGNLDSERDWGFAGDYVEGMYLMMQQEQPDDYVLATGQSHSVKEFLAAAFKVIGISDWEKYIVIDPQHKRPAEVDHLQGIATKAHEKLGWQPKVNFEELVKMMVEADLQRLAKPER